jgi:hypothetical protein
MKRDYVYFIQAVDGGPIKIGRATDPWVRLSALQAGNWRELRLVGVVGPGRASGLEARLHVEFSADRLVGEWFSETGLLWQRINELCRKSDARQGASA